MGRRVLGRAGSGGAPQPAPGQGVTPSASRSCSPAGGGARRGGDSAGAPRRQRPGPLLRSQHRRSPRPRSPGLPLAKRGAMAGKPRSAAAAPLPCTGGETACSSGELRLSLSHSIFLPLVKPLYVVTSIMSHDSYFTPLTTWSLTLPLKTVNRFAFLKQIICFVSPQGCLYSFH